MKKSCSHLLRRAVGTFVSLTLVVMIAMPAQAQDTSSQIRGRILDSGGQAVSGANVVVTDTRTSVDRNYISSSSGTFLATGLPVGGPYVVTINNVKTIDIPSISLGDTYNLTINLQQDVAIEEIITIGQTADLVDTAPGPAAIFDLEELNSAVNFNRDIKDVYGIDPRLNLDGFQVNCAGKHPRFNSITLDGVSQNDRFGLNTNGYATATGMPFPFDSIQMVAVELAPFDVSYGGFSACNINAVTKSGSNEFEANVFYEFTNESLINDSLDGSDLSSQPYDETRQGFSFGGPIIKDRLFFFASYEESEEPRFLAQGFAGSGGGEERPWLSQTDYDRLNTISQNVYNYDTGGQGGNGAQTDEKYLLRLDYSFNADHQLSGIYNYYDGVQSRSSDSDPDEFEFANHYYDKGAEFETLTFIYDAQWTDAFSTEIFFSQNEMNDSQVTVGPKDMGDHQISVGFNTVYLGADDSRQANALSYEGDFFKLSGQYLMGDHVISGGYEKERLEVFNLFVQQSRGGEYDYFDDSGGNGAACDLLDAAGRFADQTCGTSGIDKFELGKPSRIYYGSGGGTNIATDAAALFENTLHSVYLQDELYFNESDLTITAGLRYDWFASDDRPKFNQNFTDTNNGLRNDANIDGVSILMPRLGFTWGVTPDITLRGGIGLYSGGNPNVWLSNAWSNDGITNVQTREDYRFGISCDTGNDPLNCVAYRDSILDGTIPLAGAGRPGMDPTQVQFDEVANTTAANGSDSFMVLVDPDYKQPGEWKFSLGGTWDTPLWGIRAEADIMYTRLEDPAIYKEVSQDQVGTSILGHPILAYARGRTNYMLSNDSGTANSTVFSLVLDKAFDFGLDARFGYAFTDGEDVSPMTSFTAGSSWENLATNDPLNPVAGNSNYITPHRFTLRLAYAHDFFGDNTTRITLMAYSSEGQPASLTMFSDGLEGNDRLNRTLLYVPTGASDPAINFDPAFPVQELLDYAAANGIAPGTFAERNSVNAKWSSRVDLRIDQEIPLFVDDLKARGFLKIYNLGNMLNSDWGRQVDAPFSSMRIVDGDYDAVADVYNYDSFSARDPSDLQTFSSLWEVRMGLEVNFR
jgi:Carboxypeptidase regulatory-like domain